MSRKFQNVYHSLILFRYDLLLFMRLLARYSAGWRDAMQNGVVLLGAVALAIGLRNRGQVLLSSVGGGAAMWLAAAIVLIALLIAARRTAMLRQGSIVARWAWNPRCVTVYLLIYGTVALLVVTALAGFYRTQGFLDTDAEFMTFALVATVSIPVGFILVAVGIALTRAGRPVTGFFARTFSPLHSRAGPGHHGLYSALFVQQVGLSSVRLLLANIACFATVGALLAISSWVPFASEYRGPLVLATAGLASLPILLSSRGDFAIVKFCRMYPISRRRLMLGFAGGPITVAAVAALILTFAGEDTRNAAALVVVAVALALVNTAILVLVYDQHQTKAAALWAVQKWIVAIVVASAVFFPAGVILSVVWLVRLARDSRRGAAD